MKKRVMSFVLVLTLIIGMVPVTARATASSDYTQWRQGDAEWNQAEAWPAPPYTDATMRYMSQAGCLVTSIAMLLRHYNVITDSNVNNFNPWICNEALKAAGAFNSAADLIWTSVQNAYSGFVYQGSVGYSASRLVSLYNQGYACVVAVNSGGHFVAVRDASSTANITIMDPGWGYTSLSSFSSVNSIYYFKATPSEATEQAPLITLDAAEGGENTVHIRGWAFDPDTPDASLAIHVYINYNEKKIGSCMADQLRTDVNNVYGCGDYHGFEADIPFEVESQGTYYITCYALNTTSGGINTASNSIEVTVKSDATGPVISNVQVVPDTEGYTVTCDVSDVSGIEKVLFPSWSSINGQDDLEGADGSWPYLDVWKGEIVDGTATFRVNRSDHNNDLGKYRTDIYAFDTLGNASLVGVSVILENDGPEITNVSVVQDTTGYTVTCAVADESEIAKVQFPTWSENNGQDDLLYAGDGRWKEKNLYLGTVVDGVATYHVDISEHNYDTGLYHTHIYAYDALGNFSIYEIDDIEFVDSANPIIGEPWVAEVTAEGFTLKCDVSDNVAIDRFDVYIDSSYGYSKSYEVVIEENVASWFVPFSDHGYKVNCEYYGACDVYDTSGNSSNTTFEVYVEYDAERNITYHLDGGANHADNPKTYSILSPYINLQVPTKEGYSFVEWYILDADNNKVTLTNTTELSGEDIDVYASWSCNHSWDGGVVITEPTCIAKGERKHTCDQCGETKTEDIAVTEHDYEVGTCTVCGAEDPDYEEIVAKITVNTVTATAGNTVAIDVIISDNPGIVSATLKLNYNTSVLTLVEVVDAGHLGVQSHKPELTSPYTLVWVNDTATENFDYNGTIVTLKFEIAEDAEVGDYIIELSYDYDNYDIYNYDAEKVKFSTINGVVSVIDTIIGDVNGDGVVNNLDRMVLTRYLADWENYTTESIDLVAADVNSDGLVNNLDRMILTRHLADWSGYETMPYEG